MHMRGFAVAILALGAAAAHADSFTTYTLTNVVVGSNPQGTITGTLTFDATSNFFTSGQLTQTGEPVFSGTPTSQGFTSTGQYDLYYANLIPAAGLTPSFTEYVDLLLPALPGSNGISLCTESSLCSGASSFVGSANSMSGGAVYILSGQLTPAVASTPEPSSIALLATGLLGGVGALRKRMQNRNG